MDDNRIIKPQQHYRYFALHRPVSHHEYWVHSHHHNHYLDGAAAKHHVEAKRPPRGHVVAHEPVSLLGHDWHLIICRNWIKSQPQKVDAHLVCNGFDLCGWRDVNPFMHVACNDYADIE